MRLQEAFQASGSDQQCGVTVSLYGEYVKERAIDSIVETDKGFATYRYINDGKTVYIVDIYVAPAFRRSHTASALADIIAHEAKSKGVTEMYGTVAPMAKGSTASLRVLLAYGMELLKVDGPLIVFRKGI